MSVNLISSSRVAKNAICIPETLKFEIKDNACFVSLKDKFIKINILEGLLIQVKDDKVFVAEKEIKYKKYAGTMFRHIANAVEGLIKGFEKKLLLTGVGYKAVLSNGVISLSLGKSHITKYKIPEGIEMICQEKEITVKGYDSCKVSMAACDILNMRKISVYGHGDIRLANVTYIKKESKKK